MVDVLSGGRLEVGMVKGAAYEVFMSNRLPARFFDRFWEAHELIMEALRNTGRKFLLGRRALSLPYGELVAATATAHVPRLDDVLQCVSSRIHAKFDYTCATFLSGAVARSVFEGYRKTYHEAHGRRAREQARVSCSCRHRGDRKTAFARAEHMKAYFDTSMRLDLQFRNAPGFIPVKAILKMMQAGPNAIRPRLRNGAPLPSDPTIDQYIDAGLMFVGTPDDVYEQIKQFYVDVGGFGNLLMMGQAGTLDHAETADNLTIFAREVLPRLRDLSMDDCVDKVSRSAWESVA